MAKELKIHDKIIATTNFNSATSGHNSEKWFGMENKSDNTPMETINEENSQN
jgi:hypothetical protein